MLMEVKRHILFIFTCMKYNLAKEMEQRVAFIMKVAGMMVNDGLMIIQWVVLFTIRDNIGGLGFKEIMMIWALSASGFGLAHMVFVNAAYLPGYITEGKLDAYLVQPKNVLVNVASSRMNASAIGDLLYGFVLIIIAWPGLTGFLLFIFFTLTSGLILASFYVISGCLAFFIKNSDDFSGALNGSMVNFSTYPEALFNGAGKWLLFTLIPVGFTTFLPIRVLLQFNLTIFLAVIAFTAFIIGAAFFIFHRGLKRYSSSNLMKSRT